MLVTGDGDLIHAVNFLRLHGRQTIIIGVEDTMNILLATAADSVLLYERDVEPLCDGEQSLVGAVSTPTTTPSMDAAFEWVKEVLRENKSNKPYPFDTLGHELKQRHGFDARGWYRIPFKRFMLEAQAAGHVRIHTMEGLDYAILTDVPESELDGAEKVTISVVAETAPQEVNRSSLGSSNIQLESLSEQELTSLIGFIQELGKSSPYMTLTYIVDNLIRHSILPRLSRKQMGQIVDDLAQRSILLKNQETCTAPDTSLDYSPTGAMADVASSVG